MIWLVAIACAVAIALLALGAWIGRQAERRRRRPLVTMVEAGVFRDQDSS